MYKKENIRVENNNDIEVAERKQTKTEIVKYYQYLWKTGKMSFENIEKKFQELGFY